MERKYTLTESEFLNEFNEWRATMPINSPNYKNPVTVVVTPRMKIHKLRDLGHEYFDMLWKMRIIDRNELYQRLADWLGIPEPDAHFSKMDNKLCVQAIEACITWLNDNRRCDLDFGASEPTPYFDLTIN